MTRYTLFAPLPFLLAACMTLPGSDTAPSLRYDLPLPDRACTPGGTPLALTVSEVSPGLDSDRIASRDARSGEIAYLKGTRWIERSAVVVEKALARDLECHGHTVLSGHHRRGAHDQLVCEVRALNLVRAAGRDTAEAGLSCVLFRAGEQDRALVATGRSDVRRWSAPAAVEALGAAYRQAVGRLLERLRPGAPRAG